MATSDGESCSAEDRALEEWNEAGEVEADIQRMLWPLREDAFRAGFRAGQASVKLELPSLASYATHEQRIGSLEANMRDLRGAGVLGRLEQLEAFTPERGAAAGSQLGVELSKIRDRLNAMETSGAPRVFALLDERIEALEANQQRPVLLDLAKTDFGERLAKMERMHEGQPEKTTQWECAIEARLDSITERANEHEKRIDRRVEALEKCTEAQTLSFDQRLAVLEGHHHASRIAELEQWRRECSTAVIPWPAEVLKRIDAIEANMRDLRAAQGQRIEALEEEFAVDGHVHTLEHQLRALERAVFPHDADGQKSIPARIEALEREAK